MLETFAEIVHGAEEDTKTCSEGAEERLQKAEKYHFAEYSRVMQTSDAIKMQ